MTHPITPLSLSFARTVSFLLILTAILMASPVLADSLAPPPPPEVDTPPPPPAPATVDPSEVHYYMAARPVATQPAPAQPVAEYQYSDPYGFTSWLNGIRGQYGLGAVGHDANLSSWAAVNNSHQQARGMGHHVMGSARRQNAAMGGSSSAWSMWMADPPHAAALLDPTITMIGIAADGWYWTYNAY